MRSLGLPEASIVALSGVTADVVITVAWEITWYQYRVSGESGAVHLAQRGQDPHSLDPSFTDWNARVADDGRVVPDIAQA